jgi:hypothetical protein
VEGSYDAFRKSKLPLVSLSAQMKGRKPEKHSGLLQLDFDGKHNGKMTPSQLMEIVKAAPFVAACFVSPSGNGVKAVASCPPDAGKQEASDSG